jgi:peptidase S46-like protein
MKHKLILLVWMCGLPAAGDEGMWLFQQFPKDAVQQKYGFEATRQFLDHMRLSSVRIGAGSGAFVSSHGLLLTNRRLVSACVAGQDSFYAAAESAETRCVGLDASVLVQIDDVTDQVKAAAQGATVANALDARNAATAHIETECAASSGYACTVVTLFSGGRYDLYRYRKYADIRLVFAPEYALAFFGRERDSLTYLRYGLDIAFLRAYENGKPAATPDYLKWSAAGAKDGELVFAVGNPAATARATTAAQLTFLRDTALPVALARWAPRIQQLTAFAARSENDRKAAQPVLTAFLESYKSAAGKLIGLRDDRLVSRKTIFDSKIRQAVENDPKLGKQGGLVWDQVATAYKSWAPFEKPYQLLEASPAPGSELYRIARALVRGEPVAVPGGPIHDRLETILLTQYLEELKNLKGKDAPVRSILGGQTPEQAAGELVKSTKLKNAAERRQPASSDDAMIRLARLLDEPGNRLRKKREDLIESLDTSAAEKIAQYRYALFGDAEYPDATSTPRVEFGTVKGYTDRAGTPQPYAATLGGLFYRRTNEEPYQAPPRWVESQAALNLTTPLDFVSTCDIGGGDAGSPTVNRAGELVGVVFDGNLESLPNTYLYVEEQARAVHVAVQGIVESLEKVYHAAPLLRELGIESVGGL